MHTVPNLSVRHLKAVVALARFESFVAAASYLNVTQSGLTRLIQQAEKLVGMPLFIRSSRRVLPTDAGALIVQVSQQVLIDLSLQLQAARAMDGELRGQISISSLMSISHRVLPHALMAFRREHSGVHVHVRERLADEVLEDVRRAAVDFGITSVETIPSDLSVIASAEEPCFLVVAKSHPLAQLNSVPLERLAGEPLISMPTESGLRKTIDLAAHGRGIALNHSIIINQFGSLFDFVSNGLGSAIVPAVALPSGARKSFVVRRVRPKLSRRIVIVHLKDRPLTSTADAFLRLFHPLFMSAIRES